MFTNTPSRMELAGWALVSLVPSIYCADPWGTELVGYFSILCGLAIATSRVSKSLKTGFRVLSLLVLAFIVVVLPLSAVLPIDTRAYRPITVGYFPVPLSGRNPGGGDMWNLLFLSGLFALITGVVIRMNLKGIDVRQGAVAAVSRSTIVFVLGLGAHMHVVPHSRWTQPGDPCGKLEVGLWMMFSLYTLLLSYVAFYIALFNDLLLQHGKPLDEGAKYEQN